MMINYRRYRLFFILFTVCYSCFFLIRVFTNKQDLGGDFAQYFLMGRHFFDWMNPGLHLESYPAVLPVWPLIIGSIDVFFGVNFYVIGLLNISFFARTIFILSLEFKTKEEDAIDLQAVAFGVVLFASTPFLERFEQAQPTFLMLWLFAEIFTKFESLERSKPESFKFYQLLCICTLGTLSRPELLLYVLSFSLAVLLFKSGIRRKVFFLALFIGIVTQFYTTKVSSWMGLDQYGGVPSSSSGSFARGLIRSFLDGMLGLQQDIADLLATLVPFLNTHRYVIEWLPLAGGPVVFICTILVFLGAIYPQKRFSVIGLMFLLTSALMFERMQETGHYSLRYILPYIPFMFLFLLRGFGTLKTMLLEYFQTSIVAPEGPERFTAWKLHSTFSILIMLTALLLVPQLLRQPNFMADRFRAPALLAASDFLDEQITESKAPVEVGFFKPRTLQLLLDDRGVRTRVSYTGAPYLVEELCIRGGYALVHVNWGKGQLETAELYLSDPNYGACEVVWAEGEYIVLASRLAG